MIQNSKRRYRKIKYFTNRTKLNFSVTAGALRSTEAIAIRYDWKKHKHFGNPCFTSKPNNK